MSDDIRRALPPFPPEKPALAHDSSTNNLIYQYRKVKEAL
jgi:hypothetical protein